MSTRTVESNAEIFEERARQIEEALDASFGFRAVVAGLRRDVALRSMMHPPGDVPISIESARFVAGLAARLTHFASSETTTQIEQRLVRALIETTWRHTPIFVRDDEKRRNGAEQESEPRYVPRLVPNTDPWHIVLAVIFQTGRFVSVLLPREDSARSSRRRGRQAVGAILSDLECACVDLPAPLPATINAMKASGGGRVLPNDVALRVDAAADFLLKLIGAPLPKPHSGFEFRVRLDGLGGKGDGARLSPWGAAVEFARHIGCPPMRSLEDAVRLKTPQSPR